MTESSYSSFFSIYDCNVWANVFVFIGVWRRSWSRPYFTFRQHEQTVNRTQPSQEMNINDLFQLNQCWTEKRYLFLGIFFFFKLQLSMLVVFIHFLSLVLCVWMLAEYVFHIIKSHSIQLYHYPSVSKRILFSLNVLI